MADDRLMFPIGFDLDTAVKDAEKDWNNTYYDRLNKVVQKKPLVAKITFDTKQLDNLDDVRKRLQQLKLQPVTPETKSAIQSLVKELKSLEKILERINKLNKSASAGPDAVRAARISEIQSRAAGRASIDREKARQAAARAAQAEAKLEQAVRRTGNAYSSTSGYIDRLLKRTLALFGVHQITRFAQKLREVTAEFELQRVSLGAIIQDQERANALFRQIKTFAVQSPFEIKDLVGYVKQLSAYRIETDKLFDTTKRLADVSAGLGVDMGRLILAFGQVKAASVLRGQEVRQFTETGIPLIQLLADKFTALRGEVVSTSEVFDLISKRAVSFKMVEEIFNDMTNAGGMFYNMQEKQAQTLAGQWSNLKDSLSIMYDEMGSTEKVRNAMEFIIDSTKSIAKNWKDVEVVMYGVLGGRAIRGVMKSFISSRNSIKTQTENLARVQKRYNQALEEEQIITRSGNELEIIRAQRKTEAAQKALDYALKTKRAADSTTLLEKSIQKIGNFFKGNWIMLAVAAITAIATAIAHSVRKANELKNALADVEKEGKKTTNVMARNFEILATKAVQAADGSKEQKDALDELQRTYRDIIPTHKITIENLKEMAGNYELLTDAIREYNRQQILSNKIETIVGQTSQTVSDAQKKLRKGLLRLDFIDERTIERAFVGIEEYARKTSDDVSTVVMNAFKDFAGIEVSDTELRKVFWADEGKYFKKIIDAYRKQEKEIQKVSEGQDELLGLTKQYSDAIKTAQKNVSDWADANKDAVGTYAFDIARAENAASEYLSVIKRIFSDSGLTFQDVWVDGRFIDFDAIEKELREAGDKVSSQAYKAFGKVRSAYEEIVPTEKFSKVVNEKLSGIAEGFGVNMDLVKRYMKDGETNIKDYAKSIADSIEELQGNIKAENALLDSRLPLNPSEIERAKKSLAQYEDQLKVLTAFYEFLQNFIIEKEKGGRKSGDKRLSNLKEEISLLEKVYSKYKEYTQYISKTDAQERINREFGKTLEIFKKYGIELPKTSEEYQSALRKLQDVMRGLPDSQKDVLELGFKIENVDWEDTKKNLEKEIKRLADEVSRTKTAKEFFDKMLNMTGDRQLSATVTMSVYGDTGEGLKQRMIDQIQDALKSIDGQTIDLSLAVDTRTLEVNYLQLARIVEDNKDRIAEKDKEVIDAIIKNGLQLTASRIEQWEKEIKKDESFSEQRIRLARETAQKIAEIERDPNLQRKEKDRLQAGYARREQERAADLAWGSFKDSSIYVKMFDDLDNASSAMLTAMRDRLKELESQWGKSLNPTELKELQSRMNEIENQLARKNPFSTLSRSMKEYIALTKEKSYAKASRELESAMRASKAAADMYAAALSDAQSAEEEYNKTVSEFGAGSDEARNSREVADAAWDAAEAQRAIADAAKDAADNMTEEVDRYKQLADLIGTAGDAVKDYVDILGDMKDATREIMESFGVDDIDMQFFDDITGGIEKVMNGTTDATLAVSKFMSGDIIGGIKSSISAVKNLVTGVADLAYAGRISKANKEIKRQQEIIDALSYSYGRLQKAAEDMFSSEFVSNFRKQQENLRAQIEAVEKQLAAEESKGKKTDNEKVKEYQESIRELKDELSDLYGTLSAQMLGSDLTSAARTFAQSWLDAYKEFGDTRKAIEGEMQSMMENLIVEAAIGAVMQKALKPVFDMIDDMGEGDFYNDQFWSDIVSSMNKATNDATAGADAMMKKLEAAGVNIRDFGNDFTGISKDIASASEESILGLTSLINTSLYYVSNIDRNVAQIVAIMQGGGYELTSGEQMSDLVTLQNQHLAHLPQIAANTAATAERCERAAQACEAIAANLDRVIKPNGVAGNYRVNTSLSS